MKSAWPWDPRANGSSADRLKSPLEGQGAGAFCAMEFLAHGDVPLKLYRGKKAEMPNSVLKLKATSPLAAPAFLKCSKGINRFGFALGFTENKREHNRNVGPHQ